MTADNYIKRTVLRDMDSYAASGNHGGINLMGEPVLLVDDEESILSSLVRLFRNEDYEIFRATSGMEGL